MASTAHQLRNAKIAQKRNIADYLERERLRSLGGLSQLEYDFQRIRREKSRRR